MNIAPGGYVYTLPCIAGHVGADAAGVALAEAPYLSDELTLIADVGTNAEILFGNKDGLLACSSPTGPAFEGAQISCGQRAAPGAIERVRIDRETLEPRYKVIGCDLWSDEPGFAEATVALGVTGVCGSGIIEAIAEMYLSGVIRQDGLFDGSLVEKTKRVEAVGRSFAYMLARGRAASVDLSDRRARDPTRQGGALRRRQTADRQARRRAAERVTLVGAFGSHIDTTYAMALGLIPDCELARVVNGGNSAGTGARIALLNLAAAPRSRTWCAASRRSRPRSSQISRPNSSPRWRFRTPAIRSTTWRARSSCRSARRRRGRDGAGGRRVTTRVWGVFRHGERRDSN